jgi:hypothetical protein
MMSKRVVIEESAAVRSWRLLRFLTVYGVRALALFMPALAVAAPLIHVEPSHFKEDIYFRMPKEFVFVVENTGDEDLIISEIKKSCSGCTTTQNDCSILQPGAKGTIRAVINQTFLKQDYSSTLFVRSNAGNESALALRMEGKILPNPLGIRPELVELMSVQGIAPAAMSVSILSTSSLTLTSSAVVPAKLGNSAGLEPQYEIRNLVSSSSNELRFEVGASAMPAGGTYKGEVLFDVKQDGASYQYSLPVVYEVKPEFEFRPGRFLVDSSRMSDGCQVRVLLKYNGTKSFRATSVTSGSEQIVTRLKYVKEFDHYFMYLTVAKVTQAMLGKECKITVHCVIDNVETDISYPVSVSGDDVLDQ